MKQGIKMILTTAACSLVLVSTASAHAQDASGFGAEGQIAIGGERLTGYYSYKGTFESSYEGHTSKNSLSGSQLTLGVGNPYTNSSYFSVNPNAVPRVGVDFFVIDNLSVGGNLGYFSMSSTAKDEDSGQSQDGHDLSGFIIAPRVGYQIGFNDMWGVWLRGGFSYISFKNTGEKSEKETATLEQVNIEGMFNVSLTPGFALMFGPTIDLGIGGSSEQWDRDGNKNPADVKLKWNSFGAAFGVFGYL